MNQHCKKSLDHQDSHALVECCKGHRVSEVRGLDLQASGQCGNKHCVSKIEAATG
jgi:hypothetical protein